MFYSMFHFEAAHYTANAALVHHQKDGNIYLTWLHLFMILNTKLLGWSFKKKHSNTFMWEMRDLTLPTYRGSVPVYSSSTKNWFQTQFRFCLCRASHECLVSWWGLSGAPSADSSPQRWTVRSQTALHMRKLIWAMERITTVDLRNKTKTQKFWNITENAEN